MDTIHVVAKREGCHGDSSVKLIAAYEKEEDADQLASELNDVALPYVKFYVETVEVNPGVVPWRESYG